MAQYKLRFVDRVLDPVHGLIDLTQVEKELVELPIFRRLQSIKQLSLVHWVFPGAEHTRYMHSLGVMHIADQMAVHLTDTKDQPIFTDADRQLIRLAGLLHDIGHYPLSHVTESLYRASEAIELTLRNHHAAVKAEIDALMHENHPISYMKNRYSEPMHHEAIGARLIHSDADIKRIISSYCPFISMEDITDIIVGRVDRNPHISAMVQILHSEMDADGIDYVMRDATFSGTSYGSFELGLLLRNLVVAPYHGVDIVGIRPKGIAIADQYLTNRYFAYTQVFFNRHVAVIEEMAKQFSRTLITLDASSYPSAETLLKYVENHATNDRFLQFTDRAFWAQLDRINEADLKGIVPDHIVSLHEKLLHYQAFPMIKGGELVITSNDPKQAAIQLRQTEMYQKLEKNNTSSLILFHSRRFTTQLPEDIFCTAIHPQTQNEWTAQNTARLQEGVAVIESDQTPHLLSDDSRSLMSLLFHTRAYILREYAV